MIGLTTNACAHLPVGPLGTLLDGGLGGAAAGRLQQQSRPRVSRLPVQPRPPLAAVVAHLAARRLHVRRRPAVKTSTLINSRTDWHRDQLSSFKIKYELIKHSTNDNNYTGKNINNFLGKINK
jgi:hypothetical protein